MGLTSVGGNGISLEEGLDGLVLAIEGGHVCRRVNQRGARLHDELKSSLTWDEILDNVH